MSNDRSWPKAAATGTRPIKGLWKLRCTTFSEAGQDQAQKHGDPLATRDHNESGFGHGHAGAYRLGGGARL